LLNADSSGARRLTEQLAKNLLPTQRSEIEQNMREMALALMLEHGFTKDQILEHYCNRVYFGSSSYGIGAAAQRYFGKSASQVTLYQAAMLVGLLKAPSRLNPLHDSVLADRRARSVLQDMVAVGYLTKEQLQYTLAMPH
jgi:penicillin-binding protein 1A